MAPALLEAPPKDLHRDPSMRIAGGSPLHSSSGLLREAYRAAGADVDSPAVEALVDRGIPPIRGGATGLAGASFMHNLPPQGSYVMDSELFFRETERNDVPQEQRDFPGLGGAPIDQRLSNVGIIGKQRLIFEGSLVVGGTGAVTATYQWPWNVLKRFTLNANGQTALISCTGLDLRARRSRLYRNPEDPVSTAPATTSDKRDPDPGVIANGTYPVYLVYDIPIVHDDYSLTAALFAQSDQTNLSWRAEIADKAECFSIASGGTVALTGTIHSTTTFFDVPYADTGEGRKVLIPDLQWLHGYVSADKPFENTGKVQTPFIRTAGQLLSVSWYFDNGGAAVIKPVSMNELAFIYGGNRRPRVFNPTSQLLEKNAQDYNGLVLPEAGYAVLDFEVDNPARDLVYPKGVTELALEGEIPTGTSLSNNSHVHYVEETLFAGA